MTANEFRKKYIQFFESKAHKAIDSASLIPENDSSVLFTTAGMHPLVPYLLGEKHPKGKRLVSCQKCVRTGDIDEVGDDTHLTFFEMLGNWSLGDYFKEDAIKWSYEFLTECLMLNPEMLAISVFEGDKTAKRDEEAEKIWKKLGIPESRIAYLSKNDNWWPAGGKHTGPQGPDTEIFYWAGENKSPLNFDPKDAKWVEIWNIVFMQFIKKDNGQLEELAQKNIDTGMGLERVIAVLNNKKSVFDTELFEALIKKIEILTSKNYNENSQTSRSMRIIADHIKAVVMILSDGEQIAPSNSAEGYIVRRLIRRAVRFARNLEYEGKIGCELGKIVIEIYGETYRNVVESQDRVLDLIEKEEKQFSKTLTKGIKEFEKILNKKNTISGADAFLLYSSFGFPIELTEELAKEKGVKIDEVKYKNEFEKHQELSRIGSQQKFAGGLADDNPKTVHGHTATHLLHKALRQVLGNHVEQCGSNINPERLRFDFKHNEKMTDEQKNEVEKIVNDAIQANYPVICETMTVEDAKNKGAIGLFEKKYAGLNESVKVFFIGNEPDYFSVEICGGPHVKNTGEIKSFKIIKEEAVASQIRRIKAVVE